MREIKPQKLIIYISSVIAIITTCIIVVVSFFNVQEKIYKQMYKNYIEQLEELTGQIINTIYLEIEYSVHILEKIGECKNLKTGSLEEKVSYLKKIKNRGNFTSLGIIDEDGNAFDTDGNNWKIKKEIFLENLKILKSGRKYCVSDVFPSKERDTREILIAIPLYKNKEIIGFIFGNYPIIGISEEIGSLESQQYFQLVDIKGNYISNSLSKNAFSDGDLNLWEEIKRYRLSDNFSIKTLRRNMERGKKGVFYFEYKEDGRYAVYQPLGINKWYVFSIFTRKELNERAGKLQNITKELLCYLIILKIILIFIVLGTAMYIYKIIETQSKKLEIKNKTFRMLANKTKDIFFEIHLPKKTLVLYDFSKNDDEVVSPVEDFYPENMLKNGKIKQENYDVYKKMYEKVLDGGNIENYIIQLKRNGEWKWFRVNAVVFNSENIVGILEDFTKEKEKEFELLEISEKSKYDFLTELYNRETFEREFNLFSRVEQNESFVSALFILDLDNFKEINDIFGHRAGDEILKETAHILRITLKSSDILGRLGGDEFILLIKNAPNLLAIEKVAQKINSSLIKTYTKNEREITISCSIGVKILEKDISFKKAYEGADLALYKVKYNGRNSYCINE